MYLNKKENILYRFLFVALFAALSFIISPSVFASSFRAMPLRLYLNNETKTEVLKIVNEEKEPVTVQLDVKTWDQGDNGQDEYGDTRDIIAFPKMATIEGGGTKIFRIGYNGAPVSTERSFRVFVQELPVSKPGESVLKFALNLSLPVFVSPQNKHSAWTAQVLGMQQESLQLKIENGGNSHLMINKIKAVGLDTNGKEVLTEEVSGWYTLTGRTRTYEVPIPYQQCLQTAKINIDIEAKGSKKLLQMPVGRTMCSQKSKTTGVKTKKTYSSTTRP